jgi:MraZ protein
VAEKGHECRIVEPNPVAPNLITIERPRGFHSAKVDPKGRLKIPTAFQEYFKKLGEEKFFVTTTDAVLLDIYPLSVWRENEKRLDAPMETDEELMAAEQVRFMANCYGGDATMDGEGRILIPQELRKALGLSESQVYMVLDGGKIAGYNEAEYTKRLAEAKTDLQSKVRLMKLKGFR